MKFVFNQEFYELSHVRMEYYNVDNKCMSISMEFDNVRNCWYHESDINIICYKYVLNEIIRLNDPNVNKYIIDDSGEVWSVPNEIKAGYNQSPILDNYIISNLPNSNISRKEFIYGQMPEIFFGINLTGISDIHSITYICFQPNGQIFHLEEKSINTSKDNIYKTNVIFKTNISNVPINYAIGMWCVQAYMDGRCIVKDFFTVKKKVVNRQQYMNFQM